jgi:hypothetical protein
MAGGRVTSEFNLRTISAWFSDVLTASVELPDGWFGRPYDNMHRLTWSVERDDKLFLELDGRLHLILAGVEVLENGAGLLRLGCSHAVFYWREYGSSGDHHAVVYNVGGIVQFHASGV